MLNCALARATTPNILDSRIPELHHLAWRRPERLVLASIAAKPRPMPAHRAPVFGSAYLGCLMVLESAKAARPGHCRPMHRLVRMEELPYHSCVSSDMLSRIHSASVPVSSEDTRPIEMVLSPEVDTR